MQAPISTTDGKPSAVPQCNSIAHSPKGLRATTGQDSRAMAVVELGLQITHAMVITVAAVALGAAIAVIGLSWVFAVLRADWMGIPIGIMSGIWMLVVIVAFGAMLAVLRLPYAICVALVLVKLSANTRITMLLVGALPILVYQQLSATPFAASTAFLMVCGGFEALIAHHLILRLRMPLRQQMGSQVILIYDGACRWCAANAMRLSDHFLGRLQIHDARSEEVGVAMLQDQGINPENGVLVLTSAGALQGASALRWMSLRTAPGVRWLVVDLLFASPLVHALYPLLRMVGRSQLRRGLANSPSS